MILIEHASILTMEERDYEDGYLIIRDGTIEEIGEAGARHTDTKAFDEVIDASGKCVLPGLVDAHCHVGIFGEGIGVEGADGNEDTEPVMPQLRAIDAVNPFDEAFLHARRAGVTTVVTGPGSANVFGGQFAALKTNGCRIDDMLIKSPVAQKVAFGENPKGVYGERNQMPATRMATAALVRETLTRASKYMEKLEAHRQNPDEHEEPDYDFRLESLLPVMRGEIPLKAHVHRADDIFTAIRIAREFGVRLTLEHCTEAHLIADQLAAEGLPIMLGPTLGNKSKPELQNLSFSAYRALSERNVPFAIITDHPEIPIQYLRLCAALAVQSGVPERTALRAVTLTAAENTGIADRVGSLHPGKDADVIIADRDFFSLSCRIHDVLIHGAHVL